MHDAIRRQQVEAGVPDLIAKALDSYQGQNEEVLWAALFSLAVLIKEGTSVARCMQTVASYVTEGHMLTSCMLCCFS